MNLRLHTFLSDGAVIQRDVRYPVRGWAPPGQPVTVCLAGQTVQAVAGGDGAWTAWLAPLAAGGPFTLEVRDDHDTLRVREVLCGDVWICSGQSNMEMALKLSANGGAAAAAAADPLLRFVTIPKGVALEPQPALPACRWAACVPATAAEFSAIAYYFGRHLRQSLKLPLGLVQAAVSNTPGESWVPRHVLDENAEFAPILERWQRSLAAYPDPDRRYAQAFEEWDRTTDLAEREGRPIPGAHPKLVGPGHPWTPSGLYHAMIHPLTAFPIRGVIWYQGAGAPERACQYRHLFRCLIRSWRAAWGQGDFPFLYLQEAGFGPRRDLPGEHSWAELREAQALALAEPQTAMGVAIDVGEETNIHPVHKQPLGDRLALAARELVYGEAITGRCPLFKRMAVEGPRVRVWFESAAGGLKTADGGPVRGFAVSAGASDFTRGNRGFVWAQAAIEGETVVVWAEDVPNPCAVRYGWAQNPDVNLVCAATGLPVGPFRSDDYPGVTVANR